MKEDVLHKRQNKIMAIGIGLILLSITILFLVQSVSGAPDDIFNMSILHKGDNYITWAYSDDDAITSVSFDGTKIIDFDASAINFTASDLTPNSYHTFCAYSFDDYKCLMTNTTITKTTTENFMDVILLYLIFILGLVCLIVGFKEPIIGFGAFIFACIGIISAFDNSFILGSLYVILLIASVFVTFKKE